MMQDAVAINPAASNRTAVEASQTAHWAIVSDRTSIGWSASKRYLMLIPVKAKGSFPGATGTVDIDRGDLTTARVEFRAPAATQDSGIARRDEQLQSPDFFDGATHPWITFRSTKVQRLPGSDDRYAVTGDLGIKGAQYPVTLEGTWTPASAGRARVELAGTVSRAALGLTWSGKPLVNLLDPIALTIDAELEPVGR
jgi:polyisoprenoid-binding protein YceI